LNVQKENRQRISLEAAQNPSTVSLIPYAYIYANCRADDVMRRLRNSILSFDSEACSAGKAVSKATSPLGGGARVLYRDIRRCTYVHAKFEFERRRLGRTVIACVCVRFTHSQSVSVQCALALARERSIPTVFATFHSVYVRTI